MKKIYIRLILILIVSFSAQLNSFGQTFPTAAQLASQMTIGWNIGNTMEALYTSNGTIVANENAWGNPNITQRLIDSVKSVGFNTIRIPVAWNVHANQSTYVIDAAWIARVKEVVDYCINRDMYVILNIHWDNGWLEENCTTGAQTTVNAKQQTYWTQIANYFKAYNEHLLFASANEPNVDDATQMSVLLAYHQTFINAVRATGGNNSQRILIVQGPRTDIEKTNTLMTTMPTDPAANRLMAEVHFYPYQFSLMTADAGWGNQFYYWGACNHSTTDAAHNPTWGEEAWVDEMFQLMKTKFVNNGIPVVLGEFGVRYRTELSGSALTLHDQSRQYFLKYVVKSAKNHGIIPVYWCAGLKDLFNRNTGDVTDRGVLNAMMAGAYSTATTVNCGTNDCKGVAKGHAYTNSCGNCVLGYKTCSTTDCNGVVNGTAVLDNCGICTGGNTGKTACTQDCNGVWGGTAVVDNCGTCSGGTTGITACSASIQAESACSYTGSIDANNAGFKGTGFVNFTNTTGSAMTITFNSVQAQTIPVGIRYANGGTANRTMTLSVNGTTQSIAFAPTGAWTTWVITTAQYALKSGTNTITLTSQTTDGGPNIDLFSFAVTSVTLGSCTADCNGVVGGTAYLDNCSICVGGNTGKTACIQDCNGTWGGTAVLDNCATCVGGTTGKTACAQDCNGTWGGTAILDNCNTCVGGTTGKTACNQDCNGTWGGTAVLDNCATCVGGTTGKTACIQDCNGTWGGTAILDNCNACVGGTTGKTACNQDCNGDWGGTAVLDNCNICTGGNTGRIACIEQTIQLQQGWNIISINLVPIPQVVNGIDISCNVSTIFNGLNMQTIKTMSAFWYKDQSVYLNSLQTIAPGEGYLVYMNTAGTLTITGMPFSILNFQFSISNAWQLIGCPYQTPTPFSTDFNDTNCQIIKNFDGFWIPNGTQNSIQNFEPGSGYFLKK